MIPAGSLQALEGMSYDVTDGIAVVTIGRPEAGNSLTAGMHSSIRAVWEDVRDNPQVRVAIVTAAGDRHFSTGADVSRVAATGRVSSSLGPMTEEIFWSPRYNRVWKPVIAAVNGLVAGAGLHMVVDADIILATPQATFMDTHVNVGMVGAVENIGLAKRLPLGSALRITLMGKAYRMSAGRAYQLGLVDELVERAELLEAAESMARELLKNSQHAMELSKQAVWNSLEMGYANAMEYGWALLRMHWQHPDFTEGPRAFAEKREPRWTVGEI